jgi:hypothetical protein
MSLAQDRPLLFKERASLNMHLMMCSFCRQFNKNTRTLSEAMREFTKIP